jgi:hypothetical protein
MARRLTGRIQHLQLSTQGCWFLIHVRGVGRFFGHSLNVIAGTPEVKADCEFTPLPRRETRDLPRSTEIVIFNRSPEELAAEHERQRQRSERGSQNNERNSHALH